jgi:putative phosphoesterase
MQPSSRTRRVERLGLVADTHGFDMADVTALFRERDVDLILHAGDIGSDDVLAALEAAAPVVAVAGNGDEPMSHRHPWDLRLHLGDQRLFLCHWYDNYGRIHPGYADVVRSWRPHALIFGHTHQALIEQRDDTLFINPGYAGPPEPSRRRSVATLELSTLDARLHQL